jgi:hypothetical protein
MVSATTPSDHSPGFSTSLALTLGAERSAARIWNNRRYYHSLFVRMYHSGSLGLGISTKTTQTDQTAPVQRQSNADSVYLFYSDSLNGSDHTAANRKSLIGSHARVLAARQTSRVPGNAVKWIPNVLRWSLQHLSTALIRVARHLEISICTPLLRTQRLCHAMPCQHDDAFLRLTVRLESDSREGRLRSFPLHLQSAGARHSLTRVAGSLRACVCMALVCSIF